MLNGVDQKGRLSVPAEFRALIEARSGTTSLILSMHERTNCLVGSDIALGDRKQAKLERRFDGIDSEDSDWAARANFGSDTQAAWDANGRIVLPADLRTIFGIGDIAYFLGVGETFEIWNPQALLAEPKLDPRQARLLRMQLDNRQAKS